MDMHRYRTHKCDELREKDVGKTVRLSGWIHSVRDDDECTVRGY